MNQPLRPMSLGEILDLTFQIYRKKFLIFIGIAALPLMMKVAFDLSDLLFAKNTLSYSFNFSLKQLGAWLPNDSLALLASCLIWPILIHAAAQCFHKEEITFQFAIHINETRRKSWFVLSFSLWLMWFYIPSLFVHLLSETGIGGSRTTHDFIGSLILTIFKVIFLRFSVLLLLCFSIPVWAIEEKSVLTAFFNGVKSIKYNWFKTFMAWLMSFIIYEMILVILSGVIYFLFRWITSNFSGNQHLYELFNFSEDCFQYMEWMSKTLIAPLLPISVTLIYYDRRMRLEGYDIERMMKSAGLMEPITASAGAAPVESSEFPEKQA